MATATYSPVGSKPLVKPKSLMAVRSTPPFWGVACCPLLPPPSSLPPPHAAATRASARASPTKRACCRLLPINPPCVLRTIRHLRRCFRVEVPPPSGLPARSPVRGTERVPQAVTHEVERKSGGEQEQAGEQHQPPGHGEDLPGRGVGEHAAPGRGRLRHPDAQERQRRLEQHV